MTTSRLSRLPRVPVGGTPFPAALDRRSRLLGLAALARAEALPGLLIPDCSCVHTFWMRFPLDLLFLDAAGVVLSERRGVPPWRLAWHRGAAMVLERPAASAGARARRAAR